MGLIDERAAALKAAHDIIKTAKSATRDLTSEELQTVQGRMEEVKALDVRIDQARKSDELMATIAGLGSPEDADGETEPASESATLGEHFVKSVGAAGFQRLKSGSSFVAAPEFKAATDPQTVPAAFTPVLTQVDRTVVQGYRRASVADLLGQGRLGAGTNAVTYFVEGAMEGNFATVAEGGQKPQVHFADPSSRTDAAKKIAAWWDTSDEMVEDLDFWVSEINNRGLYALSMVEESQLLNGAGTGPDIQGLLLRSGIQTETQAASGDSAQDALFRAITKVQTATGLAADAIVINPADYQALRLSRDANGQYYGGGFFTGPYGVGGVEYQPPLWGMRTVVSAAVAPKTALAGALRVATTFYRKGGVRVESTNSDQGKFTKDIITTRIEERAALAVRIPAAIVKVTLV